MQKQMSGCEDVMNAFLMACGLRPPDGLIREWQERYPAYADEMADYAHLFTKAGDPPEGLTFDDLISAPSLERCLWLRDKLGITQAMLEADKRTIREIDLLFEMFESRSKSRSES